MRPLLLLPEILLFLGGLVVLMSGSFLPRTRQWVARLLAAAALLAAAVAGAVAGGGPDGWAMSGTFTLDGATAVVRVVAALAGLVVLVLAGDEIAGTARESETYALLLFATAGTLVVGGASDLLVLAVGFLLASIPLYGLIGIARTRAGTEATMKTYLLGSLFGIVLLLGITVLSGVCGTTGYGELQTRLPDAPPAAVAAGVVAVLGGLLFKAGGVPAHFWVPDAAAGAGGAVAAFVTTVPKLGALVAIHRLVGVLPDDLEWPLFVAVLAVGSMTLGNLAAYQQEDPRRLLGWSTVSQVGYLLVPVVVAGRSDLALPSLLLYLTAYTVTNLAAFAVTCALPQRRTLGSYRGLGTRRPLLIAALVVALLGFVGTPPTAVFVGKLTTATAAWDGGHPWLAIAVLLNSVLSLFYYLRWIAPAYGRGDPEGNGGPRAPRSASASSATAVVLATSTLVLGAGAGLGWDLLALR